MARKLFITPSEPGPTHFEGYVEGFRAGGPNEIVGHVKGDVVYQLIVGGPHRRIGRVEGDKAFYDGGTGPDTPMGDVKYYLKDRSVSEN